MKNIKYILLAVVSIVLLSGCSRTDNLDYVTTKEISDLLNNNESFVLNITSSNCSACQQLEPRLIKFINDHDIKLKRIDTAKFSENEIEELIKVTNYSATPTIIFYEDGVEETIATRIVGAVSTEKLEDSFKNMGYIK